MASPGQNKAADPAFTALAQTFALDGAASLCFTVAMTWPDFRLNPAFFMAFLVVGLGPSALATAALRSWRKTNLLPVALLAAFFVVALLAMTYAVTPMASRSLLPSTDVGRCRGCSFQAGLLAAAFTGLACGGMGWLGTRRWTTAFLGASSGFLAAALTVPFLLEDFAKREWAFILGAPLAFVSGGALFDLIGLSGRRRDRRLRPNPPEGLA